MNTQILAKERVAEHKRVLPAKSIWKKRQDSDFYWATLTLTLWEPPLSLVSSEVYMKRQYSACQTASMNEWIRNDEILTFT